MARAHQASFVKDIVVLTPPVPPNIRVGNIEMESIANYGGHFYEEHIKHKVFIRLRLSKIKWGRLRNGRRGIKSAKVTTGIRFEQVGIRRNKLVKKYF